MRQNLAFKALGLTQVLMILDNVILQCFSNIADLIKQLLRSIADPCQLLKKDKRQQEIVERVNIDQSLSRTEEKSCC